MSQSKSTKQRKATRFSKIMSRLFKVSTHPTPTSLTRFQAMKMAAIALDSPTEVIPFYLGLEQHPWRAQAGRAGQN
jgi:hypothetical protein